MEDGYVNFAALLQDSDHDHDDDSEKNSDSTSSINMNDGYVNFVANLIKKESDLDDALVTRLERLAPPLYNAANDDCKL